MKPSFSRLLTRARWASVLTAQAALLATACSTGAGDGVVYGKLSLPGCTSDNQEYDMGIDFFAADYFENTLEIRLQSTGSAEISSDGILILVRDVDAMAASLGTAHDILVEPTFDEFIAQGPDVGLPETTRKSPARATLYLNDTCKKNRFALADGQGELRLEKIYQPNENRRILGSFHFVFIDPRFWKSPEDYGPHAEIFGEFDFNYTRGAPAQPFP